MTLYIPIFILVLSNTFYHICAKSTPETVNPFASISVTYLVGAVASLIIYFITRSGGNIVDEYRSLNWTAIVLGIAIVGLEAGSIYMYKAGWNISTGQLVVSALLAVVLIVVGLLFYHEAMTFKKALGIVICLVGLYLIN